MANKKIGALWLRQSKDGSKKFMSGVLEDMRGDIKIVVFENDRKERENQPDFNILVSQDEKPAKEAERGGFDAFSGTSEASESQENPHPDDINTIEYPEEDINPEEIPF